MIAQTGEQRSRDIGTLVELHALLAQYWAAVDGIAGVQRSPAAFYAADGELLLGSLEVRGRGDIESFFRKRAAAERSAGRTTRHVVANVRFARTADEEVVAHAAVLLFAGVGILPLPSKPPAAIGDFSFWCVAEAAYGFVFRRVVGSSVFVGEGASAFALGTARKEG